MDPDVGADGLKEQRQRGVGETEVACLLTAVGPEVLPLVVLLELLVLFAEAEEEAKPFAMVFAGVHEEVAGAGCAGGVTGWP